MGFFCVLSEKISQNMENAPKDRELRDALFIAPYA